ncbi:unnamed protein product [Rhizoctonia solani]|uniref:Uncharacterized protein n=1 Tax=Rhizoctonia solani TaxID=456999 RepID=A0A8H3HXW7_9AGAM|nr:unnamed protein product [Rhizoctonia solani]
MPTTYWMYFLSEIQLIETYKQATGEDGFLDPNNPSDVTLATHSIYLYLMPCRLQIWYSLLNDVFGMAFFVGKPNVELNEAMSLSAARRFDMVFKCAPDLYTRDKNSNGERFVMERDGKKHILRLESFEE